MCLLDHSTHNFSYRCPSLEFDKAGQMESQKAPGLVLIFGCMQPWCTVLPWCRDRSLPIQPQRPYKWGPLSARGTLIESVHFGLPSFPWTPNNKLETTSQRITAKILFHTLLLIKITHKSTLKSCSTGQFFFYFTDGKIKTHGVDLTLCDPGRAGGWKPGARLGFVLLGTGRLRAVVRMRGYIRSSSGGPFNG